MRRFFKPFGIILLFSLLLIPSAAQTGKKPLTIKDYPQWKHLQSPMISPDGAWISYVLRPNGGDPTLYFKKIETGEIVEVPYGGGGVFSRDSRWAAYRIGISKQESEKLRKEKKPVPTKVELLELNTSNKSLIENGASMTFSRDSRFLAVKTAKRDPESKHLGTDLFLVHLEKGIIQNIGNVGEFSFNKKGNLLAYIVDAADKRGNGIYLIRLNVGSLLPLDTAESRYAGISWSEDGSAVAVLKGNEDKDYWERTNRLLAFTGLDGERMESTAYDPAQNPEFPENMIISEKVVAGRRREPGSPAARPLVWSEDLSWIYCGIREQEKKEKKSKDPLPNVDVWHWKDNYIQSVQLKRIEQEINFTYRSVFHVKDKRFLRLADETMRTVMLSRDGKWAVGRDDSSYLSDVETMRADYYLIDPRDGKRFLIGKGIRRTFGISPQGSHFLYFSDGHFYAYDFERRTAGCLSAGAGVSFVNEQDDHPDEKPPYGLTGWTKDKKSILVNHRYDLWLLDLDGKRAENLTRGSGDKDEIRFRYIKLDPEEKAIDIAKPLLLSAYGEWTKKSGFYSLRYGEKPSLLIFADKSFGSPVKAAKSDRLLFSREDFEEFPDLHVSGMDFSNPKLVTEANPHQGEYSWGKRILIDYNSGKGDKLQATLTLPAGYEQGKRYPMLVYFYEKMSQRHHQYSMPTYDDRPHMSAYASDGYLVLMPDIVFEIGRPGSSSLDCVTSAVKKVIELGYADPDRIGLQGHSWGGFQAAFMVTQTDMFACVIAGAAPSCIEGEFNQVFKSSGNNNHSYYSGGQGRMGTDPWKDHSLYRTQSAIQNADKIETPFLLLHGTDDGSVDWLQSLEYYNAARYLGKEVIFLSYPGEPHHLAKQENQIDFQVRMKEYFDHYLKGAPMPDWMKNGVSQIKKKRLLDAQKQSENGKNP